MKWQQIEADCPKACGAFMQFATDASIVDWGDIESLKGWIERFFDERGIVIDTEYDFDNGGKIFWAHTWSGSTKNYIGYYGSRLEAFTATATEAFRILEERLNDR